MTVDGMTITLTSEAEQAMQQLASLSPLGQDQLLTEALAGYAVWLSRQHDCVEEARSDINAGRVLAHQDVFAQLRAEFPDDADVE